MFNCAKVPASTTRLQPRRAAQRYLTLRNAISRAWKNNDRASSKTAFAAALVSTGRKTAPNENGSPHLESHTQNGRRAMPLPPVARRQMSTSRVEFARGVYLATCRLIGFIVVLLVCRKRTQQNI